MSDNDLTSQRATPAEIHESEPPRSSSAKLRLWQKGLLIAGLLWALLVVVPDFYRLYGQLGAFGFSADNSGDIYKVSGQPGLEEDDHIRLKPGPCWSPQSVPCRAFLAVFGGMGGLSYVREGTTVTLPIVRKDGRIENVTVTAQSELLEPITLFMLALDEIAGVIVIWLAFKLVWDRPSRMTLGFFLFAMWFNPGQYFAFYAWLQGYPVWLLTQETLQALAQGAGYAGFMIFALRFPHDRTEPKLLSIERLAVVLGAALALLQLASFANVFGVPTELVTRCAIFGGYGVALAAAYIVWRRLKLQSPLDYQRMRWVLSGCVIGIPAFIFADSSEATSFWGGWRPGEWILEAGYLISGILAIFICIAVRRRRIVNVTPELLALTATAIVLVLGGLAENSLLEPMVSHLATSGFPTATGKVIQLAVSIPVILFGAAATHQAVHPADHFLNRGFYHASTQLEEQAKKARRAASIEEIDSILVNGPYAAFRLASAAVFREASGVFRLVSPALGWRDGNPIVLDSPADRVLLKNLASGDAVPLPLPPQSDAGLGSDISAPALAVAVVIAGKLYAVAMYGPHETGADLDRLEIRSLQSFVQQVAVGYENARMTSAENELQILRQKLVTSPTATP